MDKYILSENDKRRKYLIEKHGDECYNQAVKELGEGLKKISMFRFKKIREYKEKIFKRSREIFEERFGELFKDKTLKQKERKKK